MAAGDQRVDLAFDLAATVGEKDRAAGSQLGQQGGNHYTTDKARRNTHARIS